MSEVTYEITAIVRESLCSDFERFMLERHIPDVLATGAFFSATAGRAAICRYRIRYEAHSRESLSAYLVNDAPRLREHFADNFPEGVEIAREEWEVIKRFHIDKAE